MERLILGGLDKQLHWADGRPTISDEWRRAIQDTASSIRAEPLYLAVKKPFRKKMTCLLPVSITAGAAFDTVEWHSEADLAFVYANCQELNHAQQNAAADG